MIRAIGYRLGATVLATVALFLLGGQLATGYRIAVAVTTFALVALSWPLRRQRLAELHQWALWVRLGGYAAAWGLLATTVTLLRLLATTAPVTAAGRSLFGRSDDDAASALLIFLLVIGYAALALALTSRRLGLAALTLVRGTGLGALAGALVYLTAPYGGAPPTEDRAPLAVAVGGACLLSGFLVARRLAEPAGIGPRLRQGLAAGALAAATGAALATGLTFGAMYLFPYRVPGPIADPHALSAAALNVRPAAGPYVMLLLVAPFAGVLLGLAGAAAGTLAWRVTRPDRAHRSVPGPTPG